MRKIAVLVAVFLFIVGAKGAIAQTFASDGNPDDTLAGTVITAEGYRNLFNYDDAAGNPRPTAYGSTFEVITGKVIGFNVTVDPKRSSTGYFDKTTPGSTEIWYGYITNEGNAPMTSLTTISAVVVTPSGGAWKAEVWTGTTNFGDTVVTTIEEDSDLTNLSIRITPGTTETQSPDGSTGNASLTMTTGYANNQYTGANGLTYGGLASATDNWYVTVEAPVVTLARTSTVDSPDLYLGEGDGPHAIVPGALWTFTISYSNEGTGVARNILVADKVPANCVAYRFNVQEPVSNVNVTAATMEGSADYMVTFYESTVDDPDFTFGSFTGWDSLGGAPRPYASPAIDSTSAWVKFEISELLPGEYGTLQWSVYIN